MAHLMHNSHRKKLGRITLETVSSCCHTCILVDKRATSKYSSHPYPAVWENIFIVTQTSFANRVAAYFIFKGTVRHCVIV